MGRRGPSPPAAASAAAASFARLCRLCRRRRRSRHCRLSVDLRPMRRDDEGLLPPTRGYPHPRQPEADKTGERGPEEEDRGPDEGLF